jgi:hypothetical protein
MGVPHAGGPAPRAPGVPPDGRLRTPASPGEAPPGADGPPQLSPGRAPLLTECGRSAAGSWTVGHPRSPSTGRSGRRGAPRRGGCPGPPRRVPQASAAGPGPPGLPAGGTLRGVAPPGGLPLPCPLLTRVPLGTRARLAPASTPLRRGGNQHSSSPFRPLGDGRGCGSSSTVSPRTAGGGLPPVARVELADEEHPVARGERLPAHTEDVDPARQPRALQGEGMRRPRSFTVALRRLPPSAAHGNRPICPCRSPSEATICRGVGHPYPPRHSPLLMFEPCACT